MLKIRLKRLGKKKKACYRIIIIDSRYKRDGKALDQVGFYDPLNKKIKINLPKIEERVKEGAKTTKRVKYILDNNKSQKINLNS